MKLGCTIKHSLLGEGIIIEKEPLNLTGMVRVKWKKTPPKRYNNGQNPSIVFIKDLISNIKE